MLVCKEMRTDNFLSISNEILWPFFFGGLGFALAGILISIVYFVHWLRGVATKGFLSKALSEAMVILLFLPGLISIFAIVTAVGFARDRGIEDRYSTLVIAGVATIGIAIFFYSKNVFLGNYNQE